MKTAMLFSQPILFFLMLVLFFTCPAGASEYHVGPTQLYAFPADVGGLVNDGDTVSIDAGFYSGAGVCVAWTKNNLILRGVGGMAQLEAAGAYVWGKGIWVCAGNQITVENIEFTGAVVPDHNGAGIRLDGSGLVVRNCYFHHNENGILGGGSGEIILESSEFAYNGYGDGYSHNIYINHAQRLTVKFCYLHHAHIGHELKSRAHENFILYNRISNETSGDASREIDLPNGGKSLIMGNIIQQGPLTQNGNMIAFGAEGLTNNPPHQLYLIHNTVIDERGFGGLILDLPSSGMDLFKACNNIVVSATAPFMSGAPSVTDTSSNYFFFYKNSLYFSDTLSYDYHLTALSTLLIDAATDPGFLDTLSLTPAFEYQHPLQHGNRIVVNQPDPGAYEYHPPVIVTPVTHGDFPEVILTPEGNGCYLLRMKQGVLPGKIDVYGLTGQRVASAIGKPDKSLTINLQHLAPGIYFLVIPYPTRTICKKLLHTGPQ